MANKHIDLIAAGSLISGDGNMAAPAELATATMGSVTLKIATVTGTSPLLDMWLELYDQTAADYFPVPCDFQLTEPATPKTDVAVATYRKNINGPASVATAGKHHAVYKHLPAGKYRLRWVCSGTFTAGQGFTVSAGMEVK